VTKDRLEAVSRPVGPLAVHLPSPPPELRRARLRFGLGVGVYALAFALSDVPRLALAAHATMAAYYLTERSSRLA
jgi:hypothetical protein